MLGSGSYRSSLTFRIVELGKRLGAQGHDVSLMVPSADKYNNFTAEKHPDVPGVRVLQPWQLHTTSTTLNLLPYLFSSCVTLLRNRVDVIYLYKPTPATILALVPKLLFRTPVVLDLDDLGSEVMEAQGQSSLQVRLVRLCEKLALRYADGVVVASTFLRNEVREQGVTKAVFILPNGVDVAEYPPVEPSKPRHALYFFGAINRLGLVESMLRALPEIIAKVPDTQLYMLGGGSALDATKALAEELGVAGHITFSGWIDMFDAPRYAHFADLALCVQPDVRTVRAASNMKVFQYMAMGLVPVVSNVGDLPYYVNEGAAGVVVAPDNAQMLAAACVQYLQDDRKRTELAKVARARVESLYSWHRLANELDVFLSAQVSRKSSGAKI